MQKKTELPQDPNHVCVELLSNEASSMMMDNVPPIDTFTLFSGVAPIDKLKAQVKSVIEVNPWLAGRLVKRSGGKTCIEYAKSPSERDFDKCFAEVPEGNIDILSSTYDRLLATVADLKICVKFGKDCLNKNEPLFKVAIISINKEKFALVVSLSHIIADGHTYYSVMKMLSNNEEMVALVPNRKVFYDTLGPSLLGPVEASFPLSFSMVCFFIWKFLTRKPKSSCYHYTVNSKAVAELKGHIMSDIKKDYKEDDIKQVSFVSTNDIISSKFFSNSSIHLRLGFMVMNFRERVKEITNKDAGNYEGILIMNVPCDTCHPKLIRASLTPKNDGTFRRTSSEKLSSGTTLSLSKLPGLWELLTSEVGIISNWSSFDFDEIRLPGCKQLVHLPCLAIPAVSVLNVCVIFRPRPNETAAVVISSNEFRFQQRGGGNTEGTEDLFTQKNFLDI